MAYIEGIVVYSSAARGYIQAAVPSGEAQEARDVATQRRARSARSLSLRVGYDSSCHYPQANLIVETKS